MDSPLSVGTASTISRTAIRVNQPCVNLAERQLATTVVLKEDTYQLDEDNQSIPIPAGTVATLLDDSDDEQNQTSAASVVVDNSKLPPVTHILDDARPPQTIVALAACETSEMVVESVPDMVSKTPAPTSAAACTSELIIENVVDSSVACELESVASELPGSFVDDSGVSAASIVSATPSISASDLYVQEEEEVIMDEASVPEVISAPPPLPLTLKEHKKKLESESSNSIVQAMPTNKGDGKLPAKKGGQTKVAKVQPPFVVENLQQKPVVDSSQSDICPPSPQEKTAVAKRDRAGCTKLSTSAVSTSSLPTVVSAVSASGRPQRNTPRRSTYEMLHGTDLKTVGRRPADHEPETNTHSHRSSAKRQKTTATKASEVATTNDEKPSLDETIHPAVDMPVRGRGRPHQLTAAASSADSSVIASSSSETISITAPTSGLLESHVGSTSEYKSEAAELKKETKTMESSVLDSSVTTTTVKCEGDGGGDSSCTNSEEKIAAHEEMNVESEPDAHIEELPSADKKEKAEVSECSVSVACDIAVADTTETEIAVNSESSAFSTIGDNTDDAKTPKKRGRATKIAPVDGGGDKQTEDGGSSGKHSASESSAKRPRKKADAMKLTSKQTLGGSSVNSEVGCRGPGFPYSSFMAVSDLHCGIDAEDDETSESGAPQQQQQREERSKFSKFSVNLSTTAGDTTTNWMVQKIRELEDEVEDLQEKLAEARRREKTAEDASKPSRLWQLVLAEVRGADGGEADAKLINARLEEKLRKLDRELDERSNALKVREGRITRRERRLQQREHDMEQRQKLYVATTIRQSHAAEDDSSGGVKDPLAGGSGPQPSRPAGRVKLLNKEMNLELREHEVNRQRSFIEDERQKLVAKERELKSRERALVDADALKSLATVSATSSSSVGSSSPTTTTVVDQPLQLSQHLNGKVVAEFSDNDSDDDGFGQQGGLNSLSGIGGRAAAAVSKPFLLGTFDSDEDTKELDLQFDDTTNKSTIEASSVTKSIFSSTEQVPKTATEAAAPTNVETRKRRFDCNNDTSNPESDHEVFLKKLIKPVP